MDTQIELIHQTSTWLHFIGGYYSDEDKFVEEARKYGISRRAPAQIVRGMEFGDRLIFLRYTKGKAAYAFAEGQIIGLTLDGEIAKLVGKRLIADGRAEFQEGGGMVQRECGSYFVLGTFVVKASMKETMSIAQEVYAEKLKQEGRFNSPDADPMFVMVNARLTQAYKSPVYLSPSPSFTRGFIRSDDSSFCAPENFKTERKVVAIEGYAKKERRSRKRADMPMLPSVTQ